METAAVPGAARRPETTAAAKPAVVVFRRVASVELRLAGINPRRATKQKLITPRAVVTSLNENPYRCRS
jgi:hypothetical protein